MKRKVMRYVARLINETGIKVSREDADDKTWRLIIATVILLLAGLSTGIFSIINNKDFYKFVTPIPAIAAIIIALCGILAVYFYRADISEMLHEMDTNLYSYPDEDELNTTYSWYLEEENIITIIWSALGFQLLVLFLVCSSILGELIMYRRITTFIYPVWIPWQIDGIQSQLVVVLFQIVQSIFGVWFNYVTIAAMAVAVFEFLRQYERLTVACMSLKRRTCRSASSKNQYKNYDDLMRGNIIHCIKHLQMLHKNFQLLKNWFTKFYSCELAICMMSFAFVLYVMINATSFARVTNFLAVTCIINMNFLTRCFAGEIFADLNDNLAYVLFWEIEWCELNKENQRLLVIFHKMARRPYRLYGFSIFEATRVTFARIIRSTYSSYNLLNMLLKKQLQYNS